MVHYVTALKEKVANLESSNKVLLEKVQLFEEKMLGIVEEFAALQKAGSTICC